MHVLITGGAGFLGSHLCERYLRDGHRVTCLDSLVTGQRANLAHLEGSPDFAVLVADVAEVGVATLVDLAPDLILHFASPASPPDYTRLPFETIRAGSTGLWCLLDVARALGARLLFASTSEIYGEPLVHPQPEGYWGNVNPIGVRSIYDESKRFGEMLCAAYRREFGVNTALIRIFNTYGPRMRLDDGRVIPNMLSQALAGEALTVYGDGSQTRSFCYVDDLVEGIVRMAAHTHAGPVNLGNPVEFSIRELARCVQNLMGQALPLRELPLPGDDPTRRRPDITLARETLAWEPTISLETGLQKTLAWFRAQAEVGH